MEWLGLFVSNSRGPGSIPGQGPRSLMLQLKIPHMYAHMLSHVWLCVTPLTVVHEIPLSMGSLQARILEWVVTSFSRGSSQPRGQTGVSCSTCGFFTTEPPGKPIKILHAATKTQCSQINEYILKTINKQKKCHLINCLKRKENDQSCSIPSFYRLSTVAWEGK